MGYFAQSALFQASESPNLGPVKKSHLELGDPGPFSPAMLRLCICSITESLSLVTRSRLALGADPLVSSMLM